MAGPLGDFDCARLENRLILNALRLIKPVPERSDPING